MKTTIYGLIDPTTKQLRYIGKTNNIKQRFKNHLNSCRDKNTHKRNWINYLKKNNLKPEIEIIDIVDTDKWKYWEIFYISYFKMIGCNLTNYTTGGDGLTFANKTSFKNGHGAIPIYQIDLKGNIINTFESAQMGNKILKYKIGTVDKLGRTTHGFIFYKKATWDNFTTDEKNNVILKTKRENRYYRPNSVKTRFKIGHNNNKSIKINQIDKNTLNIINTFNSIKEAQQLLNISKISLVINNKRETAGGFKWEKINT